jgi:serine/threonine protein kinase/tetratricopeptide (TPR) repeat protein
MQDTLINNRYLIKEELGRGGMGVVYRAQDTLLERDTAVKVLLSSTLGSQGRARLLREAQAAARLNHPNIINIFDAGATDGMSYIVMELLDGESLFESKPQSLEETLHIVRQVCDALEHAHAHGIIHRDLKPENVIVTSRGIAKLTDFGLSRSLSSRASQDSTIVGTVYYLAPEQALRQDVDLRADLYALGVMMYELIAGRLPFVADDPLGVISQHLNAPPVPPSTHNPNIPPALDALILRLLSKRAEDRPASATEVRAALDRLYDEPQAYDTQILSGLSPLDRLARGRLVGRREEFNQVRSLWERILAENGTGSVLENTVVIGGETGVGKTPLVKEIRSLAQVSDARTLFGECYARESAPYTPVIQILRAAQPLPDGLPDLVVADLQALSPDLASRQVPSKPSLSPLSVQQRLFESLFALFATLAERKPLVLALEDAQWADSNSLLFLHHLARRARATRLKLMIVLTYQPGELETNPVLRDLLMDLKQERLSLTIDLAPFNREQTRELLNAMFMEEISDNFLDAIYQVTEGNLFFIEEICKALIESGKLFCDGGQWQFSGIEELQMPQSVRIAVQMRINRLPASVQELLKLASLIGRDFDYEILRRACEIQDEDQLIEALELAEHAQLIQEIHTTGRTGALHSDAAAPILAPACERFAFAHALIPTILREEISSLRRHRLHRRIAMAIEEAYPEDLEELAYHFGQAGDQDKARLYTIRAGDRAQKLYANTQALNFYNEALTLTPENHPDRFHILASRAQVYDMLAERDLQHADIETMLSLADERNDDAMRCDALIALADLFLGTQNYLMKEPAEKAVEIARRLQDPVREGRALRDAGWAAWIRHDFHESISALETAVARFRQAGLLSQAAECLHMLSLNTGLQSLGELEASKKFAENSIQLSRMAGDPRQEAIGMRRLSIVLLDQNRNQEALDLCEQAMNLHRELGDRHEECLALNTIAVILAVIGQHEEAYENFKRCLELSLDIKSNMGFWMAFVNLEWYYYRREGMFETGLAFATEQLERVDASKDPLMYVNMLEIKAIFQLQLGLYPPAMETLREAIPLSDQAAGALTRAGLRIHVAKLEAEIRHFNEANAALDEAWKLSGKFERPADIAWLYIASADIARMEWEAGELKQIRRAAAQIQQALALLRETRWTSELAHALQTAAWVELAHNHPEQALAHSQEAMDLLERDPVKPEGYQYVQACALWANGRDDEANALLEQAYQRVMLVAGLIKDDAIRNCWLEDVPINRQIVNDWVSYHGL